MTTAMDPDYRTAMSSAAVTDAAPRVARLAGAAERALDFPAEGVDFIRGSMNVSTEKGCAQSCDIDIS